MKKDIVFITTGDLDGIGLEVSSKALQRIQLESNKKIIFCRSSKSDTKHIKSVQQLGFKTTCSFSDAIESKDNLVDLSSSLSPVEWVIDAAKYCSSNCSSAIVTAPMSKTLIQNQGYQYLGHTDILKDISNTKNVFMTFVGDKFSVLLVTAHIPFNKVETALTEELVEKAICASHDFVIKNNDHRPLAILGLNPHSGENGLIGSYEQSRLLKIIKKLNSDFNIAGPIVPDAAFLKDNWSKYSLFVSLYHDQGLIPFKLVHGQESGVHISLGLPFLRTSVDHGTAKDIFGLDKANPASMTQAISWALNS